MTAKLFAFLLVMLLTKYTSAQTSGKQKIKTIVVAHALEQSPQGLWYPFLNSLAKEKKLIATIPQLPNPHQPQLTQWLQTISLVANQSPSSTILIGHSLGATTLLNYLASYSGKEKFPLVVLVAPTVFEVGYDFLKEFFANPFQLSSLQNKVERFVVIISPTDPILKPDPIKHGLLLVNEADAKLIVLKNGSHFWEGDDLTELKETIAQEVTAICKNQ